LRRSIGIKEAGAFLRDCGVGGGKGVAHDVEAATESIRRLEEFDASPDVFVAIAHDDTLLDVVDFFPKTAGAWKEKGGRRIRGGGS
jgi:hypothetical protein